MRIGCIALVLLLAGCDGGGSVKLGHRLTTGSSGVTARYPLGWRATRHNDTAVTNPALCFVVRRGAVEVKLVEYLPPFREPPRNYRPRPRRFRMSMLGFGDEDWSPGRIVDCRGHGRGFFFGLVIARHADPRTVRRV